MTYIFIIENVAWAADRGTNMNPTSNLNMSLTPNKVRETRWDVESIQTLPLNFYMHDEQEFALEINNDDEASYL